MYNNNKSGILVLEDGTSFCGKSFGYDKSRAGEVVFSTGMVGYPEAITDPSFVGQILVLTYPLVGNYGVPQQCYWESDRIHIAGLIVSSYNDTPCHFQSTMTLSTWLKQEKIPALEIEDTRLLTQHIRDHGAMLGKILFEEDVPFYNPNQDNLVKKVSTPQIYKTGRGKKVVVLIDCGVKRNIVRCLIKRGIEVVTVPWNWDLGASNHFFHFDAIVISNGPGNPEMVPDTIRTIRLAIENKIPTLGICLGHQLLALAAGGDTYKMKYGHRSQNQPCLLHKTQRCYMTTQNHGFAVGKIPPGFQPWFLNANDGSNEGIKHASLPFISVQFHPEAAPGPADVEWIFDYFIEAWKKEVLPF